MPGLGALAMSWALPGGEMGSGVAFGSWLWARGGRGEWDVGMIPIDCQHRNTLVNI